MYYKIRYITNHHTLPTNFNHFVSISNSVYRPPPYSKPFPTVSITRTISKNSTIYTKGTSLISISTPLIPCPIRTKSAPEEEPEPITPKTLKPEQDSYLPEIRLTDTLTLMALYSANPTVPDLKESGDPPEAHYEIFMDHYLQFENPEYLKVEFPGFAVFHASLSNPVHYNLINKKFQKIVSRYNYSEHNYDIWQ